MHFQSGSQALTPERKECIDGIIASYDDPTTKLLEILLDIQDSADGKYISEATAYYVADRMNIKPTQIYDVISFFSSLSDQPRAKYPIQVCSSIVCKINDSNSLLENLKELIGKDMNEATYDGKFIIEEVPCFGACDVAPAFRINGVVYGNMDSKEKIASVLKQLP